MQAENDVKLQERSHSSASGRGRNVKASQSGRDSTKRSQGVGRLKDSAQKKDNGVKPRSTGKRLQKPNSESFTSEFTASGIMSNGSVEPQTYRTQYGEREKEAKEKHVVSMLEMTEKNTEEKDGKVPDGKLNHIVNEDNLLSRSILKERKNNASKPGNLTKTVNKTIRQLYKLNKVKEAENLSDVSESKLMTEKELDKAVKRELLQEREEKKRLEAKTFEKSRREAFFLRMEELERLEEE